MKEIFLIALSLIGLAVSFYIYYTKKYGKEMYCIIGKNCDEVVKSKYGKTFGIENTVPGMIYFVMVFFYGIFVFSNGNLFKGDIVYYFVVGASVASVAFSVYLTGVQAFVLRKWCEYCIVSAICSVLILIVLIL